MINISWTIVKNYRNFMRHIKFWITNAMCCDSAFASVMAVVSSFLMIFICWKLLYVSFSLKCNILSHLGVILAIFLLMEIFFSLQNQLCFLRVLLKIHKTVFTESFLQYKPCLFSIWLIAQIVDIVYPQGMFFYLCGWRFYFIILVSYMH